MSTSVRSHGPDVHNEFKTILTDLIVYYFVAELCDNGVVSGCFMSCHLVPTIKTIRQDMNAFENESMLMKLNRDKIKRK